MNRSAHHQGAHHPIPATVALLVLLALAAGSALALWIIAPSAPAPADAPADGFSAMRAIRHVERIAAQPRPSGSEAHAKAREWIVGAFGELGLEAQVNRREVAIRGGRSVRAASVENIVARMPGRDAGPAILLMAHYDTRPQTPGAGDDAAGVSALLEAARALRSRPVLGRDVIFLITDGEEAGLLGARAFLANHLWRHDVGVVINVEARGQRGPAILFQIVGNAEAPLVSAARRAGVKTVASSLTSEVYRRLPNDTDLTPFGEAGIAGINLAIIGGMTAYHTPLDTVDRLDRHSLQDLGRALLALTVELAERPIDSAAETVPGNDADAAASDGAPATDAAASPASSSRVTPTRSPPGSTIYFDLLGGPMIAYPKVLAWLFAALAIVLWLLAGRAPAARVSERFAALLIVVPTVLVAVPAVFLGAWIVLRRLAPDLVRAPYGLPYDQSWLLVGMALVAVGLLGWILGKLVSASSTTMLFVALAPWALLAVVLAASVPGASFLASWPLIGASMGLLLAGRRQRNAGAAALAMALGLVPALVLLVPVWALLAEALTISATLVLGLMAALIALFIVPFLAALRSWSWLPLAAGLALLAVVVVRDRPTADRPTQASLVYRLDADTGKADWLAFGPRLGPWRAALLGEDARRDAVGFPMSPGAQGFLAEAPVLSMPTPQLTVITEEPSFLRARLSSPRGAPGVRLRITPEASDDGGEKTRGVEAVWIGSERVVLDGEVTEPVDIWLTGLPEFGLPIGIERQGPIVVDVADQHYDFRGLGDLAPTFPDDRVATSSWFTDSTFVIKRFRFAPPDVASDDAETVP